MTRRTSTPDPPGTARRLGGLLLWFAVLGGAVAWAVHLFFAWGVVEVTCLAGHQQIGGVPLEVVTAIAVIVPGLVTVAALLVSVLAYRRVRDTGDGGDGDELDRTRFSRTKLLAVVGLWANLLFVAIIAFDGIALVVFSSCQR
ncbi:hypothetical protein [Actinophytocola glycyrrhizae]|uniref:Uncharacterized protein n=1 Tax=Actinophytocola glycyrrhizae TaxID=2044873 RepID=A0ABV9SET9_9PSEU